MVLLRPDLLHLLWVCKVLLMKQSLCHGCCRQCYASLKGYNDCNWVSKLVHVYLFSLSPSYPLQLSARLLTYQEQVQRLRSGGDGEEFPLPPLTTVSVAAQLQCHDDKEETDSGTPSSSSSERLWEVIRYVRREKEIAVTKQELAESESLRCQQEARQLERELREAQQQLRETSEAARHQTKTAAEHAEVLAKVRGQRSMCALYVCIAE